ncbi:MAG: DUF4118 domain-containing protein [Propionibacteriaceae bacterium]|nr:DUF4118 domain-containing protein [Propionibacteriaceae bacterium]
MLLGAAPGVGKTYAMLDEGRTLKEAGKDVVVALVETHGRPATTAMTEGLEILPRQAVTHRGVELTEMDVDAVIARDPDVALVDELAHTNAPGSRHEKRWEDVGEILDAGIDVIATVNIQHIESLNDVVQHITGVVQHETIPDGIVRQADQVEIVDLTPEALRDRLSAGHVYTAERIDAALSNYFRVGNLTALRELALLWVADEVDLALKNYRTQHGIADAWEARERVVVALTGGSSGDTLLRRGARIAARSGGGELLAVHVVTQDGLRSSTPAMRASNRLLVEHLGGSYHEVVGDDIPQALVDFAKAVNATQLVLGAPRRSWFSGLLPGRDVGATVIRESESIDIHIVNTTLPKRHHILFRRGAVSLQRRLAGFLIALIGGPVLTWVLSTIPGVESITTDVLAFQLLAVIAALVGGIWAALFAALWSGILLNYYFIPPLHNMTIHSTSGVVAVVLYAIVAVLVSLVVDRAARQTRITRRIAAESEILATVAGSVMRGQDAAQAIVDRIQEAFNLDSVRLVSQAGVLADVEKTQPIGGSQRSTPDLDSPVEIFPVGERAQLEVRGPGLAGMERRLMGVLLAQLDSALEAGDLARTASEVAPLAASERMRATLLAALSHELRRPLATATEATMKLRSLGRFGAHDRVALLSIVDENLAALSGLINDLLDTSKLREGVLVIDRVPVSTAEVIHSALKEVGVDPGLVELNLGADVPDALADKALLKRVVVNLVLNASRYAPEGTKVRIATSAFAGTVEIRVADRGPGVPPERWESIFRPFERQGDFDETTGLGLGLSLSRGFVEGMGGTLTPETTPGGGLTMVIGLAAAGATEDVSPVAA